MFNNFYPTTTYNAEERVWSGNNVSPLYNPKISLAQALLNSMSCFGSKLAQISDNNGICMTFDEIRIKTIRAAQNLQVLGYKPKQTFTLLAKYSHHVAPITFASIAIGCPINALDVSFGRTELIHMLKTTKPALVFCEVEHYDLVSECLNELNIEANIFTFVGKVGQSESVESLFKETQQEHKFIPVEVDGYNDTAMIVCSSGTTGLPKGVCLSHAVLLESNSKSSDLNNSQDIMFAFGSLYWISGVWILLRGTLTGATRIITTEAFTPELQLRIIERHKVTYTSSAVHHLTLILKSDRFKEAEFSSLKYWLVGGSQVPLHMKIETDKHLPNGSFVVVYGMSEIGCIITYDYPISSTKDTVGRLLDGIWAKIVDSDGNRCDVNEDGEICLKVNNKFLGYYGNQQATDELIDEEGFVVTGDIGHFDEDGDLHMTGRKKELLIYCGFQFSPVAVDAYLMQSPDIKSACLVGIPDIEGDLPAAVIIRTEGSKITEKDVFDMVAAHFANQYKLRGGVYFVNSLPTTASGKILRRKVKEMAIELRNASST